MLVVATRRLIIMNLKPLLACATLALSSGFAMAAPITPTFTSFGTLAGATFGGTGIPNTAVAIGTSSSGLLTLGLTAHQRFTGPNLANDGAGTFKAFAGVSTNPPSPGDPYATWNFGVYIGGSEATDVERYVFEYDFDPSVGTDESAHGTSTTPGFGLPSIPSQASWNLGMDFLALTGSIPGLVAPTFSPFDPNAIGQYTFRLTAFDGIDIVAQTAIVVDVQAVPEPGSLALAGAALLGLAAARRRRA